MTVTTLRHEELLSYNTLDKPMAVQPVSTQVLGKEGNRTCGWSTVIFSTAGKIPVSDHKQIRFWEKKYQ